MGLGPSFRTLTRAWAGAGEALGEVSLPEGLSRVGLDVHPLVLDGCFQTVGVARDLSGPHGSVTYLPFGWERFWLTSGRLPESVICHVRLGEGSRNADADPGNVPETMTAELRIHNNSGALLGGLSGYSIKRATPVALLPVADDVEDLLYEVQWRERPLPPGMLSADFFPDPAAIKAGTQLFAGYLADAGFDPDGRDSLLGDLEQWSWSFALATLGKLGWRRQRDMVVDAEDLRERLQVQDEHRRLFRRVLELAARTGALNEQEDGRFAVLAGSDDPWPENLPQDPVEHASVMTGRYPNGLIEAGLFLRSGAALPEVLRGREDPLTLLFSSGEPTAADLYLKAPVARAANQMLAEAVRALVVELPEGRRLRVIEVGAGTGSATASVLPELPEAGFNYVYTDISAGFFAEAEARFGDAGGCIEYCTLDIEKDPSSQGFDAHGYDVIIASNVLHATRCLDETLGHCRRLLAPGGHLVALENLSGLGWMDLTFGQLDGWWRFADSYRPHHALASPAVWRQALGDAGFDAVEVLGVDESDSVRIPDKGVIVAQGPAAVSEPPGLWLLAADCSGMADRLAMDLAARNQTVLLAVEEGPEDSMADGSRAGVFRVRADMAKRESWQSVAAGLPGEIPLKGLVHLLALDGCGGDSTADEITESVGRVGASALAMVQGVTDANTAPDLGVWFVTRGAQFLEFERGGEPAGSALWGFGKAVAREAAHLRPRMIDLDPGVGAAEPDLVNELMYPDDEDHIALRAGRRQVARLVRAGSGTERLVLPDDSEWVLAPDPDGVFDRPSIQRLPARTLEPREVRVAVTAAGINFWDVFRSLGFIEEGLLGREMCGHILDIGSEVASVAVGDKVVGLGFGAFGLQMITHEELVAPAPAGVSATELATIPSAFVSAALSFESSGLEAGERVLIHAGAGGVGLAAIQLVQAAGAEVYATSSAPKQGYLRSLGVKHVFDSRTTAFAGEIMAETDGAGVDIVLNSLTGEGFIDASLSCLKHGGRFVEMARRDIYSHDEMAAARPDVTYDILELDVLKKTDPERVGRVLRTVMARIAARELKPIIHSRWPMAEAGAALSYMRSARHLGKIILTTPPIENNRLRADRTYLVTGGLGGIGCALAGWLADRGAGAIVLNGRRPPDTAAEEIIRNLQQRGVRIRVELADVTDAGAVDRMLALIDRELPPLGGVVHSVGALSDGALTNQTWDRFETVLWPKILGAWHLHCATSDRDLDMFVLFSSRVGVMGNPGQSNHAAANAFLDQLAHRRRAMGLPGQAIAWGAWSEIGEAAEQRDRIDRQRSALGGRWFTPEQGLKAFDQLVREDVAHAVVMSIDWSVFEEAVAERPRLVEDLLSAAGEAAADGADSRKDLLSRFGDTLPAERENLVVAFLQDEVQAVLRLPSAPSPTVGFFDLGMDSLMAVELRNRLNRALSGAYTAPNTLVFDYPDIAALAAHLASELATDGQAPAALPQPAVEPSGQPAAAPEALSDDSAVAIVGMACRFPGAPDLPAFWRLLEDASDLVTDGRRDPGPWHGVAGNPDEGDGYSRRGAFLEDIDKFDAAFFGIRPIEARTMDPRQRLLLETTWHALEDAGMDPARLKGSRTGVYIGTGNGDYRDVAAAGGESHGYLGTTMSVTAGRISFALGLTGPAIAMDLACASSLAAIHQAASALRLREVETALVGGVNAILSSEVTAFMRDVGMLSTQGRCSVFDAAADGFVRGEGCGVVVLKRLSEARADCDRIWGVIRGSALNQNGSSAGLTVPNGPAQEQVIEEALSRAGVAPADVDFLEAHGAGSDLGDPIEVQAAATVYGRERDPGHPLLIGSVKANIGHLECAAGVASLIKTVLAMNKGRIPKQLHFSNPSMHLDWDSLPVQVINDVTDWPSNPGRPPRAGVSSFGISGTNSHVVVEGNAVADGSSALTVNGALPAGPVRPVETALPGRVGAQPGPNGEAFARATRVLPLSAKSPQALQMLAGKYLAWLDERQAIWTEGGDASAALLADMAWTAGIGRSHLGHRAGIVFHDVESLRDGLTGLAAGSTPAASILDGPTPKLAFAFDGDAEVDARACRRLYESEPVIRAILDRCDTVIREERGGASLLNEVLGNRSSDGALRGPEWVQPAVYALACGLTALWESIGVRPDAVAGRGIGGLAAAWAAGVCTLEDGLRLAAARGADFARPKARVSTALPKVSDSDSTDDRLAEFDAALSSVELSPPSMALVSEVDIPAEDAAKPLDASYWRKQMLARQSPDRQAGRLADLNVAMVMVMGAPSIQGPVPLSVWPSAEGARHEDFAGSAAAAYHEGLPVSFGGLFAGEMRRRISVPSYPFQRRRHWIEVRD